MKIWNTTMSRRASRFMKCLLVVSLFAVPWRARAEFDPKSEAGIKAAYLFKFAPFVEWPDASFANESAPLEIGVLGDGPITPVLEQIVKGQTVRKRPFLVKRLKDIGDIVKCHLLFIGRSEKANVSRILSAAAGAHLLTVSEIEGFAEQGGAMNFYMDGAKVRFEINPDAARTNGLTISSQLLDLAKIVKTKENEK